MLTALTLAALALAALAGCGDDGPPGGGFDAGLDAPVADGSPSDGPVADGPPIDGPSDGPSDGPAPGAPRLLSVITPYGTNQLRQVQLNVIVLSGEHLDGATSLTIAGRPATITGVTPPGTVPSRISANYDTGHAHPLGPVPVTVTTPRGTTTLDGGVVVTPFVAKPNAYLGRGTYASPTSLCDPELLRSAAGDTISILGGTHNCWGPLGLSGGQTIEGAADGTTILRNGGFSFLDGGMTTTLRRLTLEDSTESFGVRYDDPLGHLVVENVKDETGIQVLAAASATFHRYTFDGGLTRQAPALQVAASQATFTDSKVFCQGNHDGLWLQAMGAQESLMTLEGVHVEYCDRGLVSGVLPGPAGPPGDFPALEATALVLHDNTFGMEVHSGSAALHDVRIDGDPLTVRGSARGLSVRNGQVHVRGGQVRGQASAAIWVYAAASGGAFTPEARLLVDGAELVAGETGIDFTSFVAGSELKVRRTAVTVETGRAIALGGGDFRVDLGTALEAGANALAVALGYALSDERTGPLPMHGLIEAIGTTLNGRSYAGQRLEGPAQLAPDYRVVSDAAAVQF